MESGIRVSPSLLKEVGFTLAEWGDSTFLFGVGGTVVKIAGLFRSAHAGESPLDWVYPFQELYAAEDRVLWWYDPSSKKRVYLPQVALLAPEEAGDDATIGIELIEDDFVAASCVPAGLDFYRRNAEREGQIFFPGENARLVDWEPGRRVLTFQGVSYFDYLGTNLSLDARRPPLPPLRTALVYDGRLEPLADSALANTTGVNGLIFTRDGHLVVQKREKNVVVRPGELCSGFSGTIDRIDVVHAVSAGATLGGMDVVREMVEELGVRSRDVRARSFLGITRELIRGGAPEMFYSVDLTLDASEVLSRLPRDREGTRFACHIGDFACTRIRERDQGKLVEHFPAILRHLHESTDSDLSVPLLTNLVLWLKRNCPSAVGFGAIQQRADPHPTAEPGTAR